MTGVGGEPLGVPSKQNQRSYRGSTFAREGGNKRKREKGLSWKGDNQTNTGTKFDEGKWGENLEKTSGGVGGQRIPQTTVEFSHLVVSKKKPLSGEAERQRLKILLLTRNIYQKKLSDAN